jgi:hypothetical protein
MWHLAALVSTDVSMESCVLRLLVTANVVPSSLILITLLSSETSVLTRATRRNIPEDGILHGILIQNNEECKDSSRPLVK